MNQMVESIYSSFFYFSKKALERNSDTKNKFESSPVLHKLTNL